ncbi:type II toxin-antitoxin system RelE/ParE family toxin [Fulvivirga sp. M361]|uniref:type II toxin-antitoxin system RelE/ParE family toxin n=1 Tax=Fulvivirga sp. M361 TaxID=2594266 RepID=UPI00117A1B3A|nr:type II toxin-antitoxin system RelE/ParE family toxin [Fulvivirga sp. M361]TRX48387.1 type II toxin-antitoxin system RelE/ParE family toxin [Fulvivirga sp. M361]
MPHKTKRPEAFPIAVTCQRHSDCFYLFWIHERLLKFYNKQTPKIKERINWTIKLIKAVERVPTKYLKNITGTTLYEMRMISGTNIYRIFCFFDKGKLVVVLNGFQKKTRKTPKNEIKLAEKLQKQYYNEQN